MSLKLLLKRALLRLFLSFFDVATAIGFFGGNGSGGNSVHRSSLRSTICLDSEEEEEEEEGG